MLYCTRVSRDKLQEKFPTDFPQVLSLDKIWFVFNSLFPMLFCELLLSSISNWVWKHNHFNEIMPRTLITTSMVWHPRQAGTLNWVVSGALALGNISYIFQHSNQLHPTAQWSTIQPYCDITVPVLVVATKMVLSAERRCLRISVVAWRSHWVGFYVCSPQEATGCHLLALLAVWVLVMLRNGLGMNEPSGTLAPTRQVVSLTMWTI